MPIFFDPTILGLHRKSAALKNEKGTPSLIVYQMAMVGFLFSFGRGTVNSIVTLHSW